jgi:hypothetical protein
MGTVSEILQLLRESRFDEAIPLVTTALRRAAAQSPDKLTDVAQTLSDGRDISKYRSGVASEPCFGLSMVFSQNSQAPNLPRPSPQRTIWEASGFDRQG